MITWAELHDIFLENEIFQKIADNPFLQFGTPNNQLLGARILPDEPTFLRYFERDEMRYRIPVALDTGRYSPPPMQGDSIMIGQIRVSLSDQSTADQLTAAKLDQVTLALKNDQHGTAGDSLLIDFGTNLVQRLVTKSEVMRWEVLLRFCSTRIGVNNYFEKINFRYPLNNAWVAGQIDGNASSVHNATTNPRTGTNNWHGTEVSEAADPLDDFYKARDILDSQGYQMQAIYTDRYVAKLLERNPHIAEWARSRIVIRPDIDSQNVVSTLSRRPNRQQTNEYFLTNDFPVINVYNQAYSIEPENVGDPTFKFFMQPPGTPKGRHYVLILGRVDNTSEIYYEEEDETITLENVMGYNYVGIVAGRASPGRVVYSETRQRHPMGIYAEAIQSTQPVILHKGAVIVIAVDELGDEGEPVNLNLPAIAHEPNGNYR
ncbi:MAG: hypothetical protein F6K53_20450 [Moorea sp. SIO4A1]|uniref:hypothetical protein n=1 Tax=Moorena sp. SIO4A1 TaxID=2607835 RepID=UPI00144EA020|nr:hypothetical protein [Moorena sp. SIO4A1]NEQ59644.1 hypothetical protein [Moorena sp. SIO4A1]